MRDLQERRELNLRQSRPGFKKENIYIKTPEQDKKLMGNPKEKHEYFYIEPNSILIKGTK